MMEDPEQSKRAFIEQLVAETAEHAKLIVPLPAEQREEALAILSKSYQQRIEALGANTNDARGWAEDLVNEIRAFVTTRECGND